MFQKDYGEGGEPAEAGIGKNGVRPSLLALLVYRREGSDMGVADELTPNYICRIQYVQHRSAYRIGTSARTEPQQEHVVTDRPRAGKGLVPEHW